MWNFFDPPNTAVISTLGVAGGYEWIAYVSHDADDGAWQFHAKTENGLEKTDAVLISLRKIVEIDPSVSDIADLPLGWCARRDARTAKWVREKL